MFWPLRFIEFAFEILGFAFQPCSILRWSVTDFLGSIGMLFNSRVGAVMLFPVLAFLGGRCNIVVYVPDKYFFILFIIKCLFFK